MIDGGRQWWLAATAATAFLYLTKAYVATCNGHATRAFIKCKNMWLKEVGSNGQGVAVCAVAVDAAIDAMVVNVRGGLRCARWQLVLRGEWHSILFECL